LPTWPADTSYARIAIDHLLVSDGIVVFDLHRGPDVGSDHLPLIVDIGLSK
jgi:endonuclease/exonuclease/phosphatase (EEP) superfamily protein YafD